MPNAFVWVEILNRVLPRGTWVHKNGLKFF